MSRQPKLLLVDVIDNKLSRFYPPLNLVSLASFVISRGVIDKKNIKIINSSFEDLVKEIEDFNPDIIGFSVLTPFYELAIDLAKRAKKASQAILIIGGYHISALPESLDTNFDIGVVGEGEYALEGLIQLWRKGEIDNESELIGIPNLIFKNTKGNLIRSKQRKVVEAIDIPKIEWSLLSEQRIVSYATVPYNRRAESRRMTMLYTSRGCPYNCSFCAHRVLDPDGKGVRFFSVKQAVEEIEFLYSQYGITCIQILDDTFAVSKKRVEELIKGLKAKNLLGKVCFFNMFVRANIIDDEFADLLKQLGVATVFMGIESGSDRMIKLLKDGPLNTEIVKRAVKCFSRAEVYMTGSFMMFSPQETREDIEATLRLAKWFSEQKYTYSVSFSVTTPYPGTKLWNQALENKTIEVEKIKWGDFLMLFLGHSEKRPTVFYSPRGMSEKVINKYWSISSSISKGLEQKFRKIPSWRQANKETLLGSERLVNSWLKDRQRMAIKRRCGLILQPNKILIKIIRNPEKIGLALKETVSYFLAETFKITLR